MNSDKLQQLFRKTAQVLSESEAQRADLVVKNEKLAQDLHLAQREKEIRELAKTARKYGTLGDDYDEVESWIQEKTASSVSLEVLRESLEYGSMKLASESASSDDDDSMGRSKKPNAIEELINGYIG